MRDALNLIPLLTSLRLWLILSFLIASSGPGLGQEFVTNETVWRAGDKLEWAAPVIDQSDWRPLSEFEGAPSGVFWIRETITLADDVSDEGYALAFEAAGAFDVFFDGVLLGSSGAPSFIAADEKPGSTHFVLGLPASMATEGRHILALRTSAANLKNGENFFVEYRLQKNSHAIGDIALSMLALGAASAAAFILLYFFLAGSFGVNMRNGFLAAIAVALGVIVIVAVEAFNNLSLVSYSDRRLTDFAAMVGALSVFAGLPTYLLLRFRLPNMRLWLMGVFAVFIVSLPQWPLFGLDHDAQAFIGLCLFGLAVCACAYRAQHAQVMSFTVALLLLLGAIAAAPQSLFVFLVFLSVFLSISFADYTRQQQLLVKQAEVTAARLESEMLRRNIQPHFLMNSLTAITEWIETAPLEALRFIDGLAEEFRSLSKLSSQQLTPLSEELELCRVHLGLMGMRQRRKFSLQCDGVDENDMVPPGIFHTLIENALSHNRYLDPEILFRLTFHKGVNEKHYQLETPIGENTDHKSKSTGTGHQYVKSRLEESFPGRWSFSSQPQGDQWVSKIAIQSR